MIREQAARNNVLQPIVTETLQRNGAQNVTAANCGTLHDINDEVT
jgi:hypothetical protein